MQTLAKAALLIATIAVAALLGACGSTPKLQPRDLQLNVDPGLAGRSVQVDLVLPANKAEAERWKGVKAADYFAGGTAMRQDAIKNGTAMPLAWSAGDAAPRTINASDPFWARVSNRQEVLSLLVIAQAGGIPAAGENWAKAVPMSSADWTDQTKAIRLLIESSGVMTQEIK